MGDSKSGGAFKSYNYFGTVAGAVCLGPVDSLLAVIYDGKAIWEGTKNRSSDSPADVTSEIASKFFTDSGYLKFYWGTDGQAADAGLTGHTAYKGVAYFVARNILFGREKSTAPNLEFIVQRKPAVSTALVLEIDNTLDDGQINPVAALAELLTSPDGAAFDATRLDETSWQEAATYARENASRCYCSPLLNGASDLRRAAAQLLAMFDGALAWTTDGLLACRLLNPGVNPGGLTTLDSAIFTSPPEIASGSWRDVPTTVVATYFDRERSYKRADEKSENLVARKFRAENQTRSIDFPHATRRDQVAFWAAEMARRTAWPPVTVEVACRPERIVGLAVGDKVLVDVDPEPGGDGIAQLAIIEERRDTPNGPSRLKLVCDPLSSAVVYSPAYAAAENPQQAPEPIVEALVIPLPTAVWSEISLGVLATRPNTLTTGMRVYFDTDADDSEFSDLGIQPGFACRLEVDEAVAIDETEIDLTLADGASGVDAYLAGELPESEIEARADRVLMVVATVDGNDRVTVTDGVPDMEIMSVVTRAAVDSDTHTYTVLRGRKGTAARAWTTDAHAWLIPAVNLVAWHHPDMDLLLDSGGLAYMRLLGRVGSADADTPLERTCYLPGSYNLAPVIDWVDPTTHLLKTDGAGDCDPDVDVSDSESDLVALRIDSVQSDGTGETTHANLTFGQTAARSWTDTLNFGIGVYYLTVTATDLHGRVTASTRMVQNDDSGAELEVPDFDPPGGAPVLDGLDVDITFGTGAVDRIEYVVGAVGSAAPGGSGTSYTGASPKTLSLTTPCRLWARSGDGVTWSPWVYADFR